MPPSKRFRDMHLLSGGEKTLAAMALLFAVQSFQRPPFMVLDEVDAALDANNVRALARYVEQAGGGGRLEGRQKGWLRPAARRSSSLSRPWRVAKGC